MYSSPRAMDAFLDDFFFSQAYTYVLGAARPADGSDEDNGALVIYDAATLQEVKRLPMRKPVGKYNVYNKITRSEGTSH